MTDNQNPTDLHDPTTDALESVAATEEHVDAGSVEAAAEGVPVEGDVEALLEQELDDVVVADDAIDDVTMRRALEAILMVTDEPLPALMLARTVGRAVADVTVALAELSEEYTEQRRGFDLREVGGGWRYYTREDTAQYVERFVLDGQQARLTQAALETLAVVAYKQPVSRARVSAIRGVNVDGVMRTLITRGLVEEAGADTESQATLYRTSSYFLERMGMQSLDDLPELAPYLPDMDDMEEELAAQAATPTPEEAEGPLENDLAPPPTPAEPETDDHEGEGPGAAAPADEAVGEADAAGDTEGAATHNAVGETAEVTATADVHAAGEDVEVPGGDELAAGEGASGEAADEGDDVAEAATAADAAGQMDAADGVEGVATDAAAGEAAEVAAAADAGDADEAVDVPVGDELAAGEGASGEVAEEGDGPGAAEPVDEAAGGVEGVAADEAAGGTSEVDVAAEAGEAVDAAAGDGGAGELADGEVAEGDLAAGDAVDGAAGEIAEGDAAVDVDVAARGADGRRVGADGVSSADDEWDESGTRG